MPNEMLTDISQFVNGRFYILHRRSCKAVPGENVNVLWSAG
jgi:hypothetical protein